MTKRPNVLIAGGTGFIGRRLLSVLLDGNCPVTILSRGEQPALPPGVESRRGNLLEADGLENSLSDIDTLYYLVHSLDAGIGRFRDLDRRAAENFRAAADRAGVARVIYLGGLGAEGKLLSDHLGSRREVEEILHQGNFSTTVLRAAIIIGRGGASFEVLRALVKTSPMIPDPPGLDTRCQPIAVDDAVAYLAGCLEEERTAGETFDIGGPEIMTYRDLLEEFARAAADLNLYFPVPYLPKTLTARWLGLVSGVPVPVVRALLDGLDNEVVCRDDRIREILPIPLTPFGQAVKKALQEKP